MKKWLAVLVSLSLLSVMAGCGGGGGGSYTVYEAQILSDQPADGDIAYDPVDASYLITQGPSTVYFGLDDQNSHVPEYRAFLDFPLDGSTGYVSVPASAWIESATLEVYVNEVSFAAVVPTLIDLVSYPISGLGVGDYDSSPMATLAVDFYSSDQGKIVVLDVTPLMREAQRRGLSDLQLRLLLNLSADYGLIGIEDRPAVSVTAPLLRVYYSYGSGPGWGY